MVWAFILEQILREKGLENDSSSAQHDWLTDWLTIKSLKWYHYQHPLATLATATGTSGTSNIGQSTGAAQSSFTQRDK